MIIIHQNFKQVFQNVVIHNKEILLYKFYEGVSKKPIFQIPMTHDYNTHERPQVF